MSLQGIAASWGNVGYMGVPLCLAAFGESGLPPAMLAVIVTAVISMVFGVMLIELEVAAGRGPVRTFLRAAFNVPAELSANWGFQVCETDRAAEYVAATRKWGGICAILPLFAAMARSTGASPIKKRRGGASGFGEY